jgi:cytochrome c oxidase subunit 6b
VYIFPEKVRGATRARKKIIKNEHEEFVRVITNMRAYTDDWDSRLKTQLSSLSLSLYPRNKQNEEEQVAAEEEEEQVAEEEEPEQEEEAASEDIVVKTTPFDPRFPQQNQAKHCYTRYNEYHKCAAEKGEEECASMAKLYRSICPGEWVEKWNEERENGTWPGRY